LPLQKTTRMHLSQPQQASATTHVNEPQLIMQAAACFDKIICMCGEPRLSDNMPSTIGQTPHVPNSKTRMYIEMPSAHHWRSTMPRRKVIPSSAANTKNPRGRRLHPAQLACAQPPKHSWHARKNVRVYCWHCPAL
jgi:hypothetical protein